ncbi:LPS-assembly protein LptD [Tropicibacter naphthalenivorans]|uniref:LPS-assembly protein LptD n=1 Tax=Tropicibacter naphthalenivorans TaxID=441103 RepID=A0A0P1GEI2_9RHOB|nr:LPS assembly protein LptD [Tropicibacter naphthalenivorans]CUH80144.1 Organic solvent tolerance protein [Tropicibacter naphthalenivorans]SMC84850.1 LPS-assembly protein [Tropicibacter naphthalenivorans]
MRRYLRILALALSTAWPVAANAQTPPALLVADSVTVEGQDRLVATGNVEVLHDGLTLSATRIVYDDAAQTLEIDGPIYVTDPDGNVFTADSASLDAELRNGLLRGARLVLDQQLQLASVEARRVGGRYTQLSKVAVTSCHVCKPGETPLWQIRATRVVHDQQERQLYFDEAQLRFFDVPVFYLPHMRLPDPTLKRARGFLIPKIRSNSQLGFGIEIPYFIPIGDHQDITLTPYLSRQSRTLEYRYRRAYHNGDLAVEGAVSSDSLQPGETRGYLFANGGFDLRRDFKLSFDLKAVTDIAYLNDYDINERDRLDSTLTLSRIKADSFLRASLIHYQTLRATEDNDTLPTVVADATYERRLFPSAFGGELRLAAAAHAHLRWSSLDVDGPDADSIVDGRDVSRLNLEASWRRRWTLMGGLRAGVTGELALDRFNTYQDATSPSDVTAATGALAVELRLPLARASAQGGYTLLEPIAQIGWAGGTRQKNPNEESTRVELDQGNLLSLSRFPSADRREHGLSAVAGLRYLHEAPAGWAASLTMGRVWRQDADPAFTRSSGLAGDASDWLVATQFMHPAGLTLSARGLLDSDNRFSKAEATAMWSNDRLDLSASYLLLVTDPAEDRAKAQSEWSFDSTYRVNANWSASLGARYDLADQRLDRTGLGLQYRNECVQVDLSANREFASATNLEPSTDFDLTVSLKGFSTGGSAKEYRRTCAN